ncbi:DUF1996 domain-containing protein [Streptomyces sp. NPDC002851]
MGRTSRKRPTLAARAIAAAAALLLGGGGLALANGYASAGQDPPPEQQTRQQSDQQRAAQAATVDCPDPSLELVEVPQRARLTVDRQLAAMDRQVGEAYFQYVQGSGGAQEAQESVLGPLEKQRRASLDRIAGAVEQAGGRMPDNFDALAPCTLRGSVPQEGQVQQDGGDGQADGQGDNQSDGQGDNQGDGQGDGQGDNTGDGAEGGHGGGHGGGAGNGPSPDDFADIRSVEPNNEQPEPGENASRGSFTTDCGVNENGKRNPDNVIVAPGVPNGAHHMHDYIGNQATDAFSDDEDLANGDTSCRNQGDRSTYYWPVLRVQNGQDEEDANADGGGNDHNVGQIQTPTEVTTEFRGSPVGEVVPMPRFLRIITGDAKAFTNGDAEANASWSCTGFEDRQLTDKYPLCPEGSNVVRTFRFQSCWDGQNTDSANHRTHVAFADENGACPQGFQAIPQLVQRVVYDVAPQPNFAVDSFPEQLHKPVTDHGDFINVFDEELMRELTDCINDGRRCS